jgi:sulfur-carrier protein
MNGDKMTTVRIPGPLRGLVDGNVDLVVPATSVGAALDAVCRRHPGLRRHLRTETGALRQHVNVFLNEDDIRHLDGEATPVAPGDTVTVVPSIAGG